MAEPVFCADMLQLAEGIRAGAYGPLGDGHLLALHLENCSRCKKGASGRCSCCKRLDALGWQGLCRDCWEAHRELAVVIRAEERQARGSA